VYRPTSPKGFNGTVVVEWLNVSGGLDTSPDWTDAHAELIRDGFAWMGVSAQYAGVEGGGTILGILDLPLKTVDPARYGSLVHPGEASRTTSSRRPRRRSGIRRARARSATSR